MVCITRVGIYIVSTIQTSKNIMNLPNTRTKTHRSTKQYYKSGRKTHDNIQIDVAQWVSRLTRNVEVVGSSPIKCPVVSFSKKLYPYCLILFGSRNGFECDITVELKNSEGLMEDWLKCQISPLLNIVKTSLHNTVLIRVLLDRNQCSSCPVMERLLQKVEHFANP